MVWNEKNGLAEKLLSQPALLAKSPQYPASTICDAIRITIVYGILHPSQVVAAVCDVIRKT